MESPETEEEELVEEEMKMIDNKYVSGMLHVLLNDFQVNLFHSINFKQSEVLNSKANTSIEDLFSGKPNSELQSDSDDQLLIKIAFQGGFSFYTKFAEKVKLSHIEITGSENQSPAKLRLFVNSPVEQFFM